MVLKKTGKGRRVCLTAVCALIMLVGAYAQADEISIELSLESSRIYQGEEVVLHLIQSGSDAPGVPDMSSLESSFLVKDMGYTTSRMSTYRSVNGKAVQQITTQFHYQYKLTPTQSGNLVIGPVSIRLNGQSYMSNQTALHVVGPEKQDACILELDASRNDIFPEEEVTITLKIFIKKLTGRFAGSDPFFSGDQAPKLTIPWLEEIEGMESESHKTILLNLLSQERKGFHINNYAVPDNQTFGFFTRPLVASFELPRQEATRKTTNGAQADYFVYTFTRTFQADRVGEWELPPVMLKGKLPIKVDDQGNTRDVTQIYTLSNSLTIKVQPLPKKDKPAFYTGAVGRDFSILASVTPVECRVGDPITLTLEIQGQGKLERIMPDDLEQAPGFVENFKVYKDASSAKVEGSRKIFHHAIRPTHDKVIEVPPMKFAFFDLETRTYQTLQTQPVPLKVLPWEKADPDKLAPGAQTRLTSLDEGLLPIAVSSDALKDQDFALFETRGMQRAWAVAAILPLLYLIGLGLQKRHTLRTGDLSLVLRKGAFNKAQKQLHEADSLQKGDASDVLKKVSLALCQYISDRVYADGRHLTPQEAANTLEAASVSTEAIGTCRILAACEEASFSPKTNADAHGLAREAGTLLKQLEKIKFQS